MAECVGGKPVKRSVALFVRRGAEILILRRPDDDDELPGIWGLPAGSYRRGEDLDALVARIGRDKLGARLRPIGPLNAGTQDRPAYFLQMELVEADMEGTPSLGEWRWDSVRRLAAGRDRGSLCCELALAL